MEELHNSPKIENRVIEQHMQRIKERSMQRTIQMNLEIKNKTDWTMPKLIESVLTRKERERNAVLKEIEQKRIAKALRHQLAHQSVLSSVGQWLTRRVVDYTKHGKLNILPK